MELRKPEIIELSKYVDAWIAHPENELEATFGARGTVDSTTFLAIAQRLQRKGYAAMPQEDRLSILTQNQVRLSLQGLGVMESYCRDDILTDKPFTAMIKDRTLPQSNLDLDEYEMRIKTRREKDLDVKDDMVTDILSKWPQVKKAFRLVKRWSFQGLGIRIDMSMVRSTPKNPRGEYQWQRRFLDVPLFEQPTEYEVEVELLRGGETDTADKATKSLVRGIGEVLRAIQGNTLLIKKSVKEAVLQNYNAVVGTPRFRGVAPVTLEVKNMLPTVSMNTTPNIRNDYNVTDKADGMRVHGFVQDDGELYLIDMSMKVYRTGLVNKACARSLVDGEWVTRSIEDKPINHFLLFDIYNTIGGASCAKEPFAKGSEGRWFLLQAWIDGWASGGGPQIVAKGLEEANRLQIELKGFLFAEAGKSDSIFTACAQILDMPRMYHTDGLILTPNQVPLPSEPGAGFFRQFKWKPAKDNSIDFLVTFQTSATDPTLDEIVVSQDPETGLDIRYKILRLYVNSNREPAFEDPRATVLNDLPLPAPSYGAGQRQSYRPTLFQPMDYSDMMVNTCYTILKVNPMSGDEYTTTKDSDEPIQNNSIVECRYEPNAKQGWRWVPMRIRHDKTERFAKATVTKNYSRTLNAEATANSIWESIHNPVTLHMIRSGAGEPSEEEQRALLAAPGRAGGAKRYYMREGSRDDRAAARGLRDFHNHWIKEELLYGTIMVPGGKKVLDFSCGQAADYGMWIRTRASFVLGVDIAEVGIRDPKNGAYRRYLKALIDQGRDEVPAMIFAVGDSKKPLQTGAAGSTPEDANLLRAVFGTTAVDGTVPVAVQKPTVAGVLRNGADVAVSMFALHYFFESKETLDGFLANVRDCVAVGGYFAGCCFDGEAVFRMLKDVEMGHSRVGMDGTSEVWSIRKAYDADEFAADDTSVGVAIDVKFVTIGEEYREYLVNFEYLVKRLKEIGLELCNEKELAALKLRHSTGMFREAYGMAERNKRFYKMTDAEKEFSFLNRWFIFRRRGETTVPAVEATVDALARAVEAMNEAGAATTETTETADAAKAAKAAKAAAAAAAATKAAAKTYEPGDIIQFGPKVPLRDSLRIGNTSAQRLLAPYWQFPFVDATDGTTYPSLEHYWEAMRLRIAGNLTDETADLPKRLFSSGGLIHTEAKDAFTRGRLPRETPERTRERQMDAFEKELLEVRKAMTPLKLRSYRVTLDEAKWDIVKETYYRAGFTDRFAKDPEFRAIIERARSEKKYLLYTVSKQLGGTNPEEVSGARDPATGRIVGGNLFGRLVMEIAKFGQ
jgi:hypothetical protein